MVSLGLSFVRDQRALSRDISFLILFQSYQSLLQGHQWHHLYVLQSVPLLLEYALITVSQTSDFQRIYSLGPRPRGLLRTNPIDELITRKQCSSWSGSELIYLN